MLILGCETDFEFELFKKLKCVRQHRHRWWPRSFWRWGCSRRTASSLWWLHFVVSPSCLDSMCLSIQPRYLFTVTMTRLCKCCRVLEKNVYARVTFLVVIWNLNLDWTCKIIFQILNYLFVILKWNFKFNMWRIIFMWNEIKNRDDTFLCGMNFKIVLVTVQFSNLNLIVVKQNL